MTPGVRLERAHLTLQARSSREESLVLGLPEGVNVQEVTLDGAVRPWRPAEGRLRITLPAGSHRVEVRWHQDRGMAVAYVLPRVALPGSAANTHLVLNLPPNRWLLFVRGSSWGPSVMFWAYLIFALLVASVLGRIPGSPLTSRQWALLALGLSQISAVGALIVAGFFLALSWRQRRPLERAVFFNVLQIGLVLWALVAAILLYHAIETGLLFRPDMQVAGNGSTGTELRWYADRIVDVTPTAGVVSLPLWVYRGAMLLWALWLASSMVRWVVWAWRAFTERGAWHVQPPSSKKPPVEPSTEKA